MQNYRQYIFLVFLVILIGCPSQDLVILTIDGETFTIADFKYNFEFSPTEDSLQRMEKINEYINQTLAMKEARERGYENDPVVQTAFDTHRKEVLYRAYYEEKVIKKIKIPESDIKKVYNQIIDQYHLAQIVVAEESLARYLEAELTKGVPFDSLLQFSLDTLTENGDIGTFSVISLPPEILEPVKRAKIGGSTEAIRLGDYFYILKVIEHKRADTPTYDDVKENIKNNLLQERVMEKGAQFVEEIIEKARVEYNQEGLAALMKPDSSLTEEDLNIWVVKKYDTSYVYVKTIRDAVLYQYRRSQIPPEQLINRVLIPDLFYDAALQEDLQNRPEIKEKLQNAHGLLIYQKFYSENILDKAIIDSMDVVAYYKEHWSEYKDKKFSEVYPSIRTQLRDEKIDSLRTILFTELREKYEPRLNERAVAQLLKEE
ncbi:MAG: peptidyl-prolyl cis-trans isomerase [candidate division WOR-3 bacterium]|nr:MAG: peptidyl-prolyl cis-trans isomerase [candidate division WOR-3 bacterium]